MWRELRDEGEQFPVFVNIGLRELVSTALQVMVRRATEERKFSTKKISYYNMSGPRIRVASCWNPAGKHGAPDHQQHWSEVSFTPTFDAAAPPNSSDMAFQRQVGTNRKNDLS